MSSDFGIYRNPVKPVAMTKPSSENQPRRSQKERSDATRARILDAALKTLLERGYSDASTWAVCETGGFSKGTLLHHFRRRSDLFQALIAELSQTSLSSLDKAMEAAETGHRIEIFLDWLWSTLEGPFFVVGLEILNASRTDRDLLEVTRMDGDMLAKLLDDFIDTIIAGEPNAQQHSEDLRNALRATVHMTRGIGLDLAIGGDRQHHRKRFNDWSQTVLSLSKSD